MLCQIAQTIQQEQFESSEEKLTAFITESYEQDFTSETKKFLQGLTFQQSSPTYQDFIDFATVHELPNWECKALKTLLSQTN